MKSFWRRVMRGSVGSVQYTGPSYPNLKRAGRKPMWSRWAWLMTTASISLSWTSAQSSRGYASQLFFAPG